MATDSGSAAGRDVLTVAGEAGRDPEAGGGVRKLGVPTVLDRFIQQAVLQVLQPEWDKTFSEGSYGFRPGRSAHQAVAQAQRYLSAGHGWVVDLEKFFDRVNHDKLISLVKERVADRRMLQLIDRYLKAGGLTDEGLEAIVEGTPQGGPLSPMAAKIFLHEVRDAWVEREVRPRMRGRPFVIRLADDVVIGCEGRGRPPDDGGAAETVCPLRLDHASDEDSAGFVQEAGRPCGGRHGERHMRVARRSP